MGYVYLLSVALFFSFGGSCVKLISPYFAPPMISFMRFAVGVLFLLALKCIRRQRLRADFRAALRRNCRWILLGAFGKWLAYLSENTALSIGVSYGNILTQPVQMIFLVAMDALLFTETLGRKKRFGIALCAAGILFISWNGRSLQGFLSENLRITALFVFSGICSGLHVLSQKAVSAEMDVLDSNLTMFSIATLLSFFQPFLGGAWKPAGTPGLTCILAILLFGFNTGIGFYLNAKAIPLVPFHMVPLIQSTMVLFTILWGVLFFHEPVGIWVILGTVLFILGIVIVQTMGNPKAAPAK